MNFAYDRVDPLGKEAPVPGMCRELARSRVATNVRLPGAELFPGAVPGLCAGQICARLILAGRSFPTS